MASKMDNVMHIKLLRVFNPILVFRLMMTVHYFLLLQNTWQFLSISAHGYLISVHKMTIVTQFEAFTDLVCILLMHFSLLSSMETSFVCLFVLNGAIEFAFLYSFQDEKSQAYTAVKYGDPSFFYAMQASF